MPSPDTTLHTVLTELAKTDLTPSPRVNQLFTELVNIALNPHTNPAELPPELIAQARQFAAIGEAQLEAHWADRIITQNAIAEDFPYWENYVTMMAAEGEFLSKRCTPGAKIAFVGSGPLPFSAILLAQAGYRVTCIDSNVAALTRGENVANLMQERAASYSSSMRFAHGTAEHFDYTGMDVVILAALVGRTTAAKAALLSTLGDTLPPTTLLAARSVPRDGRQLLYPPCPDGPYAHLGAGAELAPHAQVINSLKVWRVPQPETITLPDGEAAQQV